MPASRALRDEACVFGSGHVHAMLLLRLVLLALGGVAGLAEASSMIDITTFTDNKCNEKSTTAGNVSLPLDACVVTIGM